MKKTLLIALTAFAVSATGVTLQAQPGGSAKAETRTVSLSQQTELQAFKKEFEQFQIEYSNFIDELKASEEPYAKMIVGNLQQSEAQMLAGMNQFYNIDLDAMLNQAKMALKADPDNTKSDAEIDAEIAQMKTEFNENVREARKVLRETIPQIREAIDSMK